MATLLATAGGVKKTIQKNREQTEKKQRKSIQRPLLQCSDITVIIEDTLSMSKDFISSKTDRKN